MFKDTDEALARLEAELFREEVTPEQEEADLAEEAPPAYDYRDTLPADEPVVYENYANGYRAYNTDLSDEDLDDYSEEILQGRSGSSNTFLILILCFLSLGVVAVLLLWLFLFRGVL